MTTRFAVGHTAYHHVGLGGTNCTTPQCLQPRGKRPAHPYFLYGWERRYPYAWHGGSGGVPWSRVAAESRGMGSADLLESGLGPRYAPYQAFRRTHLHDPTIEPVTDLSDWPLVRPAGYEPDDPRGDTTRREGLGLSDNEKKLGLVLAIGAIGFIAYKKLGKRANPIRKRFEVRATASRRGQGNLEYAASFGSKEAAEQYARHLRREGRKARVRKKSRR